MVEYIRTNIRVTLPPSTRTEEQAKAWDALPWDELRFPRAKISSQRATALIRTFDVKRLPAFGYETILHSDARSTLWLAHEGQGYVCREDFK